MVEELRSLILNSKKYDNIVFVSEEIGQGIRLNKILAAFRTAVLGQDKVHNKLKQVFVTQRLVQAIYQDRDLSRLALEFFDKRRLNYSEISSIFPLMDVSSNSPLLEITGQFLGYRSEGVFQNSWAIKRLDENTLSCEDSVFSKSNNLVFSFVDMVSDKVKIPGTSLDLRFVGTGSIPVNFFATINASSPSLVSLDEIILETNAVPQLDQLIWTLPKKYTNIREVYMSTNRPYKKLLCLCLAYGVQAKILKGAQ